MYMSINNTDNGFWLCWLSFSADIAVGGLLIYLSRSEK